MTAAGAAAGGFAEHSGPPAEVLRVLDRTPGAVLVLDEVGSIGYASPGVRTITGHQASDLVGRPIGVLVELTDAELRAASAPRSNDRATGRRPALRGAARTIVHRDGRTVLVQVDLAPLEGQDGTPLVMLTLGDLSALAQTERELERLMRAHIGTGELNEAVIRATTHEQLYEAGCRAAVVHGLALGAWVGVLEEDGRVTAVASAGALDAYIAGLDLVMDFAGPEPGPVEEALSAGRPYLAQDFLRDPATRAWWEPAARHGIRSAAIVPLTCIDEVVAGLVVYADRPHAFDADAEDLVNRFAGKMSIGLTALETSRRLREVAQQRSLLLRRLVTAQEEERQRIAADIHDDSVQALAAVDLRLGQLQARLRERAPDLEASVHRIQETVEHATTGLRQLMFHLDAPDPSLSFREAVEETVAAVLADTPLRWTLSCEEDIGLSEAARSQTLRILKEALINARRHAQATRLSLDVQQHRDHVSCRVVDDGVGMGPDASGGPAAPGHRGVRSMRERARVVGGSLTFDEGPSGGTMVTLLVPREWGAPAG